jgi:acetamidase/formamidase
MIAGPFLGHPLTGPVAVRGAEPGDGLAIEVIEVKPAAYGWTGVYPGRALIGVDFEKPFVKIWDLSNPEYSELKPGVRVPLAPFCGQMGVAPKEAGEHSTGPPRSAGGNLDVRQLIAGATLYLPVLCDGGLFSAGDCHAAQGDGEVSLTGIEMAATVTLRLHLIKNAGWEWPSYRTPSAGRESTKGWFATTGIGPDLYEGSRQAIRAMVAHLAAERGLTREEAYVLCSVAVDLRISEIVDAPNWVVSALLPEDLFV